MKAGSGVFKAILLALLLGQNARAEDIDVFAPPVCTPDPKPSVLFVVDNSNWGAHFSDTIAVLDYMLRNLRQDTFNVGIMMYSETGGANGSTTGAYVRAALRPNDSTTLALYDNLVTTLNQNGDKGNGARLGLAMLEAFNYLKGNAPFAGNKLKADFTGNTNGSPADDAIHALPGNALSSISDTSYNQLTGINPLCGEKFIVYISAGTVNDTNTNSTDSRNALAAAGGDTTTIPLTPNGLQDNMADEWALFLHRQYNITTYAVEINPSANAQGPAMTSLLKSMSALNGGGQYFVVNGGDASSIAIAVIRVLMTLAPIENATFASPALPKSGFDPADTSNDVYLNQVFTGHFGADNIDNARWKGNLKHYQLGFTDGTQTDIELKDADSKPAINATTGSLETCARSFWTAPALPPYVNDNDPSTYPEYDYWAFNPRPGCQDSLLASQYQGLGYYGLNLSDTPDGNRVEKGGQAGVLRQINPSTRRVQTCSVNFSSCSSTNMLLGFHTGNSDITPADLDTYYMPERNDFIDWALGHDNGSSDGKGGSLTVEKDGFSTARPSIHGDVIHAQPLAINFGDYNSPDVRVFYGSNDGLLHAVRGDNDGNPVNGDEVWAFMAPEFFYDEENKVGNIKRLRNNYPSVYYPGNPDPSSLPKAYGFDGSLSAYTENYDWDAFNDITWLFATMRRGGRVLYAFDVSKINTDPYSVELLWKAGCPKQSADADCTPGFEGIGQTWSAMTVLKSYDDPEAAKLIVGGGYDDCEDLDVGTQPACFDKGNMIFVLDAKSGNILKTLPTLRSVAGDVVVMKDDNGFATYAYAADTGGNIYRISGYDANSPIRDESPQNWTITRIAAFGCDNGGACTPNRKFLQSPIVVKNDLIGGYSLFIGSGDREKPLNSLTYPYADSVNNHFFAINDKPQDSNWLTDRCGTDDYFCTSSLTLIDWNLPSPASVNDAGWYLTLRGSERVVTSAAFLYNIISFSTYEPLFPYPGMFNESTLPKAGTTRVYNIRYNNAAEAPGAIERASIVNGNPLPGSPVTGETAVEGQLKAFCIGCSTESALQASLHTAWKGAITCPFNPDSGSGLDSDGDGKGNDCDDDDDGDSSPDVYDNCPLIWNADQSNVDYDQWGDACDAAPNDKGNDGWINYCYADLDADGKRDGAYASYHSVSCPAGYVLHSTCDYTPSWPESTCRAPLEPPVAFGYPNPYIDNCPGIANADQLNTDSDQWGDVCDALPNDYNNDGFTNYCSLDSDFDTIRNTTSSSSVFGFTCNNGYVLLSRCDNNPPDFCPPAPISIEPQAVDNCPDTPNTDQLNTDRDQWGDACDALPNDYNNDGWTTSCEKDNDLDGVTDEYIISTTADCPVGYQKTYSCDGNFPSGVDVNAPNCGAWPGPVMDNCTTTYNPGQQDFDADYKGDVCDDSDNDELTDAAELALGINPNNPFDPPIPAPGANLILGIDDRNFGTPDFDPASASGVAWQGDGNYLASGTLERMRDIVMTAAYDFCGVGTTGLWCWWWVSDDDVINNDVLPPVVISSTPVAVVHDETGFLRYEQSPGVWASAITDAFKISSNHHNRSCVVSKTHGIWCWAVNSLIDPITSTIPAELKNVTTVTDVAVGGEHACAINNGAVQCWGDNTSGKTTVPGIVSAAKQIAAGTNHNCAIHTNGTVSCWGDNSLSQLGDSNADGYVDGVSNALRIAAGDNHTCAITGSYIAGGTSVVCWGDDSVGQVSAIPAALTNYSKTPVLIRAAGNTSCVSNAPNNASESALMCWPATLLP